MQSETVKGADRWRWSSRLAIALVLVLVLVGIAAPLVWTFVSIQLRLSRNGAIANRLVESLHARFPGFVISGVASYESEEIYISVLGRVDEATRRDVEQWLRRQKDEQKIAPAIWLRFLNDADEENTIKM